MKKRSDARVGSPISSTKSTEPAAPTAPLHSGPELDALHGPADQAGWLANEGEAINLVSEKIIASKKFVGGPVLTLNAGDEVVVDVGAETFYCRDHSFTAGPIILKRRASGGEDFGDFFSKMRSVAEAAFEAEFEIKLRSFREHAKRVESGS